MLSPRSSLALENEFAIHHLQPRARDRGHASQDNQRRVARPGDEDHLNSALKAGEV